MLSISEYALYCLGAMALIISPGPDFFYVLSRGLSLGPRAGVLSALGIAAGLVVHTTLAASGLTLLLLASDTAFTAVKWVGAGYLLWMGYKTLRSGATLFTPTDIPQLPGHLIFRQGMLTNVFNPKVALTFAAFLPQFVHPHQGSPTLQIAALGFTLCVLSALWFCVVGTLAGKFGQLLTQHPKIARGVQTFSGVILLGLGVRLAFVHRA